MTEELARKVCLLIEARQDTAKLIAEIDRGDITILNGEVIDVIPNDIMQDCMDAAKEAIKKTLHDKMLRLTDEIEKL